MSRTLNEIYVELYETGKMSEFLQTADKKEIEEVIETIFNEDLKGTCLRSWEDSLYDYGIETEELFQYLEEDTVLTILDETVFECDSCGWWYGVEEKGWENNCASCDQDEDEDEE